MHKVILVDDEQLALEGLKLMIDWKKGGFEIAALCKNGTEALDALQAQNADLVVTDLYMPGMNGLDLIETARARGFKGKFLIVSGHNDFEMAQRAVPLGVSDYLFKPVDAEEAAKVLKKISMELKEAKLHLAEYHTALTAFLSGVGDSLDGIPKEGIWQALTWGSPLEYETTAGFLKGSATADPHMTVHIIKKREWLVLHGENSIPAVTVQAVERFASTQERILTKGEPVLNLVSLREQLLETATLMEDTDSSLLALIEEIFSAVSLLDRGQAMFFAQEAEKEALSHGGQVPKLAGSILKTRLARLLANREEAIADFVRLCGETLNLPVITQACMDCLSPDDNTVSLQVTRLCAEQGLRNISLKAAARTLGYNAAYLGRIFLKETGQPFHDWLKGRRMDAAAQLLLNPEITAGEAARQTGYSKYDTFLSYFKQAFGLTPEQYRKENNIT